MAEGGVPGVEDVARLGRWLARNGITGGDGPPAVRLIGGGRSNLTYRLDVGAADGPSRGRLVLRRPPPGRVLRGSSGRRRTVLPDALRRRRGAANARGRGRAHARPGGPAVPAFRGDAGEHPRAGRRGRRA